MKFGLSVAGAEVGFFGSGRVKSETSSCSAIRVNNSEAVVVAGSDGAVVVVAAGGDKVVTVVETAEVEAVLC